MLLNNKRLKYTFFGLPERKSRTFYQQLKTGKTRKKGVKTRCGGFTMFQVVGDASKRRRKQRFQRRRKRRFQASRNCDAGSVAY